MHCGSDLSSHTCRLVPFECVQFRCMKSRSCSSHGLLKPAEWCCYTSCVVSRLFIRLVAAAIQTQRQRQQRQSQQSGLKGPLSQVSAWSTFNKKIVCQVKFCLRILLLSANRSGKQAQGWFSNRESRIAKKENSPRQTSKFNQQHPSPLPTRCRAHLRPLYLSLARSFVTTATTTNICMRRTFVLWPIQSFRGKFQAGLWNQLKTSWFEASCQKIKLSLWRHNFYFIESMAKTLKFPNIATTTACSPASGSLLPILLSKSTFPWLLCLHDSIEFDPSLEYAQWNAAFLMISLHDSSSTPDWGCG